MQRHRGPRLLAWWISASRRETTWCDTHVHMTVIGFGRDTTPNRHKLETRITMQKGSQQKKVSPATHMDTNGTGAAVWRPTKTQTTPCKHWGYFFFMITFTSTSETMVTSRLYEWHSFWTLTEMTLKIVTPFYRTPLCRKSHKVHHWRSQGQKFPFSEYLLMYSKKQMLCCNFWKRSGIVLFLQLQFSFASNQAISGKRCRIFPNKHYRGAQKRQNCAFPYQFMIGWHEKRLQMSGN